MMGEYEDRVRSAIEEKYGSIPKMSSETGIAKNTIYHALERGLDNTTTRTRYAILGPLGLNPDNVHNTSIDGMSYDEGQIVTLMQSMDDAQRALLLAIAEEFARKA